jgi:hypothetical protein
MDRLFSLTRSARGISRLQLTILALSLASCAIKSSAEPALTIYNDNFAVVRDTVPLALKAGVTEAHFSGVTAQVEPDSVILRDPSGARALQILEQNYRNDPVTQPFLLSLNEGKTIDFERTTQNGGAETRGIIHGKIVRSGYAPQGNPAGSEPIIEVDGKLRFTLPGLPLFPSLGDDTILKPTLSWLIQSDQPGNLDAEVAYVTGGLSWHADYNLVSPENGNTVDLVGWVTMQNNSGKTFQNAKIKLMAGDVNKIQPRGAVMAKAMAFDGRAMAPAVTEKAFDEYHLYTLERRSTLRDQQTEQVEFARGAGIFAPSVYVYDGAQFNYFRGGGSVVNDTEFGVQSDTKVRVMREFVNAATNHLGLALPKGRIRFYRRDADGQVEFTGEDSIDHTPRDENVRVITGNAFDLVGERKRTTYNPHMREKWIEEAFEIKLRNHKKEPVEIRVREHLNRWSGWQITEKSQDFTKIDSQTIEFHVPVQPDQEQTVTYTVHYSW